MNAFRRNRNSAPSPNAAWKRRVLISYLPDWILTIFLWGIFYLLDKINGYRRLFDVTDTTLAHPYAEKERVPVWLLGVLTALVPAVIILLSAAFIRSAWDAHNGILGLILGLGLTVTFTDIVKITVGRPRPDFFDRCQLPASLTQNPVHGLTDWTACTRTDLLNDGFRSFPSGHSSFAWCGMWYLVLYGAAKLRTGDMRGYAFKSWLLLVPISCATLICISRTMDYRHNATDVIAGAVIGILGSWWSYRQYYPAIMSDESYVPHPQRIARDPELPVHTGNTYGENIPLGSRESGGFAENGQGETYKRTDLVGGGSGGVTGGEAGMV